MSKIRVAGLVKAFGPKPSRAVTLLGQGFSKDEIREKTGVTIGVADVSFEVEQGEIFVVMGLSGSGKSTLIRCLNRLIEPTAGVVEVDGVDVTALDKNELRKVRRKKMAMVFQHFALFPHRTVVANVEYGLEVQGVPAGERRRAALDALALVGLEEWADANPAQLSGGMQQRVGLARALATDPDILLMDEAFSALDPLIRRDMQDELLGLQEKMKKTIVFITHDLAEALRLGDRIAVMKDGAIVQIGAPEEILSQPADAYVASFVKDVDRSLVFTAGSVMKRPDAVVSPNAGPRVALQRMEEHGISSVFVVDKEGRLRGIVYADDVVEAARDRKESLEDLIRQDIPTTLPDTPLAELVPVAARAKTPIAVIDDERKLLGIIVRVSVLSGLARREVL